MHGDAAEDVAHGYFASTIKARTTTALFTTSSGAPAGTAVLTAAVNGNRFLPAKDVEERARGEGDSVGLPVRRKTEISAKAELKGLTTSSRSPGDD